MKIKDKVRLTEEAIKTCRKFFDRNARWDFRDREVVREVLEVKFIGNGLPNVILVKNLSNNKIEEIGECHLEVA